MPVAPAPCCNHVSADGRAIVTSTSADAQQQATSLPFLLMVRMCRRSEGASLEQGSGSISTWSACRVCGVQRRVCRSSQIPYAGSLLNAGGWVE